MISAETLQKDFVDYSPKDWEKFWSSEDGKNYLEDMRGLVSMLFKWGYPVEEYEICLRRKDPLRTAALSKLVRLGEVEVLLARSLGPNFGTSRLFSRRSHSPLS